MMTPAALMLSHWIFWRLSIALLGLAVAVCRPAILGVQTVGHHDQHLLVDVIGIFGRRIERCALGQRLPTPGDADRLVGAAARNKRVNLGLERGEVGAQRR